MNNMKTSVKVTLDKNFHEFVVTNGPTVRRLTKYNPLVGDRDLLQAAAVAIPATDFAKACADTIRDYIRDYLLLEAEGTLG